MSFLYPLGLLGLIGIPVLIIIYIIKNKYTEQVISATYLWTLSNRFLKRKNPIDKITGLISLILQILAVAFISFAIAHPVFVIPNAANEYSFVLDASGSMNIETEGVTRFDKAKGEIKTIIEDSYEGSMYSLVYVGSTTDLVFSTVEDKERALTLLDELTVSHMAIDYKDALVTAQHIFSENTSAKTYLFTDKDYATAQNIEIVNVSSHEENYAISPIEYKLTAGRLTVSGSAISYESDKVLKVEIYIDDNEEASAEQNLDAKQMVPAEFAFTIEGIPDFRSLRAVVVNEDALALDNENIVFNEKSENSYKTLVVSNAPFFTKAMLTALGYNQFEVVSVKDYKNQNGYGLYIFDCCTPDVMPKDGAVWFIDPSASVADSGFSVQGEVDIGKAGKLTYSSSSASMVKKLLKGVNTDDAFVSKYQKCGLYRSFTTLLSYEGNPVVFAGTNTFGNREVVFAFDMHNSNFSMLSAYITLTSNLLDYTFPAIIEKTSYYCGETMSVNLPANCDSIRVDTPMQHIVYLDTGSAVSEYQLTEVGVYTITMTIGDSSRIFYVYGALAEEERVVTASEDSIGLEGEAGTVRRDGKYDDLMILYILLAVVIVADWMVYCYEQYQLR